MSNYVEENLNRNEKIVEKAKLNSLALIPIWISGILFSWLLFIPTIKAIVATVRFKSTELAVTDKRVVGKIGVFKTKSLDAPLNKIQNASVARTFWGRVFNYSTIKISTASESDGFYFGYIKNADAFKGMIMNQIEIYEEERVKEQARQMASAMTSSMNAVAQNLNQAN
ncbi:MAG: PH domain-containing protein [Clostridia bacterium]|nr:PH domain-containing protein [Clostridia bacterium]MDE7337113.1 PH domain-containing protein [Clostridia bacterium]